ncbi:hypothetical protein SDC9_171853 [bioreactor metagenome]|uniref:Uncharacterized protein n=1 Tax=bioreactor metagenome TaxID=1076179 RepID=A0A645GKI7_9ZZZZ
MQFLQPRELWRKAAGAGGVDDEQHLAAVLRQGHGRAAYGLGFEVVQAGHGIAAGRGAHGTPDGSTAQRRQQRGQHDQCPARQRARRQVGRGQQPRRQAGE